MPQISRMKNYSDILFSQSDKSKVFVSRNLGINNYAESLTGDSAGTRMIFTNCNSPLSKGDRGIKGTDLYTEHYAINVKSQSEFLNMHYQINEVFK